MTFGIDVGSTPSSDPTIANDVLNAFQAALAAKIDVSVTLGPCHLAIGQDDGSSINVVGSTTYAGASVVTSVPPAVAFLIRKTTATGGKRGRGRFYLPWAIATANLDEGGNIAGASVTAMQSAVTSFLTTLATGGIATPMVLLHQVGSSTPSLVTALTADPRAATQRRRQGR